MLWILRHGEEVPIQLGGQDKEAVLKFLEEVRSQNIKYPKIKMNVD